MRDVRHGILFSLAAVLIGGASAFAAEKENFALHRPAAAKSHQGGNDAAQAFDGKDHTRWCADGGQNDEWLQVDLGSPQELTGCRITWEFGNGAYKYLVEGSPEGANWRPLVDATSKTSKDKTHTHAFAASNVRHVRITVTDKAGGHWASITEFEVFGTRDAPPKPQRAPSDERADGFLAGVKLPAGFKATLFAAPPDVGYPTCLSAAPDGTLYVGVDENGSLDRATGRGRIVRCRDKNDDGRADEFIEFAKVDSPRGVAWDGDRLYVLHPPNLSVYYDTDGDGKSEKQETLVDGIGFDLNFRGADHTTNGIRLAIDGYLYIAVGDYGFRKAVGRDGRTLELHGGGVVRVRTDGTGLEIISRGQRNIYDVAVDPQLNLFTRDNTNDGGGWNVRLSHVVPGGNYGYPTLFTNFPDEIIQPLADYGGGSPCGALYLDESQAFPAPYGQALYMVEWGANGVMRHELTPKGATFTAKEERFISLPRPTDIDADARGHLYISSWKDGGFNYSGPEVGFIIRIEAEGNKAAKVPNLAEATSAELVEFIGGSSAVLRLAAQRQLLRRGRNTDDLQSLSKILKSDRPLSARASALFSMLQFGLPYDSYGINEVPPDDPLFELTFRAKTIEANNVNRCMLGSHSENPRIRLAAVLAFPRSESHPEDYMLVSLVADSDPIVAHIATNVFAELRYVDTCLKFLDGDATLPGLFNGCCRVLQAQHNPQVVDELIARLKTFRNEDAKYKSLLSALCRLYHFEAEWDGKWWGTRPDTRGPYYSPTKWSATPDIAAALEKVRAEASPELRDWLIVEALRNRIELPGAAEALVAHGRKDPTFRPTAVRYLNGLTELPDVGLEYLVDAARDRESLHYVRAAAFTALAKRADAPQRFLVAVRTFASVGFGDDVGDIKTPRTDFLRAAANAGRLPALVALTGDGDASVRRFALVALLTLAQEPKTPQPARDEVSRVVESAWNNSTLTIDLLSAIAVADADAYADQVQKLRQDFDVDIKKAAEFAAKELRLDQRAKNAKTIKQFPLADVQEKMKSVVGDLKLGEKLFVKQGCINCHAVAANEPPKGPFLGGIATRYDRKQLTESILTPSAKIAQGFETQYFVTDDGLLLEGFVVREGGDELELRNQNGVSTVVKKQTIEERGRRELSVMPTGLADRLTLDDLASILAYLESLRGK